MRRRTWTQNLTTLAEPLTGILAVVAIIAALGIILAAFPALLMVSWNAFAVPAFGAQPITFWMAVGAVWLSIVLGGLLRRVFGRRS